MSSLRYVGVIKTNKNKKVAKVTFKFKVKDCEGTFKVTDTMVQGGRSVTGWVCNTMEMLLRHRESGAIVAPRYYNGVLRGSNIVVIPNQGTATTGLNLSVTAVKGTTGPINLATYYNTRKFSFTDTLNAGDTIEFDSRNHNVKINGNVVPQDVYSGAPLTCPAGDAIYRIDFNIPRDANGNTISRDAGYCIFEVQEWDKSGVTW